MSGGSSRIVSGPVACTTSRCSSSSRRATSGALGQVEADHQAEPARLERRASRRPAAEPIAALRDGGQEAALGRARRAPRAPRRRSRGRRRRSSRGRPARARRRSPGSSTQAPIGSPPPSPLATVITSGVTPSCSCAQSVPVRPIAALDLVEDQQGAVLVAGLAGGVQHLSARAGGSPTRPGSARAGRRLCPRSRPRARASASLRGTTRKPGTSGANGACLDSCGVADSAPIVRPWKPPSVHHELAARAALAGELDRALDRLGAGVAQEHARRRAIDRRAASRGACRARCRRGFPRASAGRPAREPPRPRAGGSGRAAPPRCRRGSRGTRCPRRPRAACPRRARTPRDCARRCS